MKHQKWADRKREKKRARNAAARMMQDEFGAGEHETNFDSLLEQRQGDVDHEQNQVGKIIIDPNLRTKRKKKRDRNTSSRYVHFESCDNTKKVPLIWLCWLVARKVLIY